MKIPSFRVGCIIDGERTVITTRENEYFKIEMSLEGERFRASLVPKAAFELIRVDAVFDY